MKPLEAPDDPGRVTDYSGLGLVDFVVTPHVNRYPAEAVEARLEQWTVRFEVHPLPDDRALVVSGRTLRRVISK
jgi:peptidase E